MDRIETLSNEINQKTFEDLWGWSSITEYNIPQEIIEKINEIIDFINKKEE